MTPEKLVSEHVLVCASSLIQGIATLSYSTSYKEFSGAFYTSPDDFQELLESKDYGTPAVEFIEDDADLLDLEKVTDEFGNWENLVSQTVPEPFEVQNDKWTFQGTSNLFNSEDDAIDASFEHYDTQIRQAVLKLNPDPIWICNEFNLDPEISEVYEHWIVSDWLARKLRDYGQTVINFTGFGIWGRTTTGQSISMDYVIQQIAKDTQ